MCTRVTACVGSDFLVCLHTRPARPALCTELMMAQLFLKSLQGGLTCACALTGMSHLHLQTSTSTAYYYFLLITACYYAASSIIMTRQHTRCTAHSNLTHMCSRARLHQLHLQRLGLCLSLLRLSLRTHHLRDQSVAQACHTHVLSRCLVYRIVCIVLYYYWCNVTLTCSRVVWCIASTLTRSRVVWGRLLQWGPSNPIPTEHNVWDHQRERAHHML